MWILGPVESVFRTLFHALFFIIWTILRLLTCCCCGSAKHISKKHRYAGMRDEISEFVLWCSDHEHAWIARTLARTDLQCVISLAITSSSPNLSHRLPDLSAGGIAIPPYGSVVRDINGLMIICLTTAHHCCACGFAVKAVERMQWTRACAVVQGLIQRLIFLVIQ